MQRREFILGGLALSGALATGALYRYPWAAFGQTPKGEHLLRVQQSPHYQNGQFVCLEPVEVMTGQESTWSATWKFLFGDKTGRTPDQPLPSQKTDLYGLPLEEDLVVWLGHSSFYLQLCGRRILIDPVFSDYASPVFFVNRAFPGTNIYQAADFPEIDLVAITHDHWDHLDYPTLMALQDKIKQFVCPLGVSSHLEKWGFQPGQIHEGDWYDEIRLGEDFSVHVLPSQHFSGRSLTRNQTEWCGFAFLTPTHHVYCSGDGGYGSHFAEIGRRFAGVGGFDLALMENGQYNEDWAKIHMFPEQSAQAAAEVGARAALPMHDGKFALARHTWQEPFERFTAAAADYDYACYTPMLGQTVPIGVPGQSFVPWWR